MKTTKIVTRAGTFKILFAVKGPRAATPKQLKDALAVAVNRVARAERRFTILRERRAKKSTRGARRSRK